jgi:hypothetical protein
MKHTPFPSKLKEILWMSDPILNPPYDYHTNAYSCTEHTVYSPSQSYYPQAIHHVYLHTFRFPVTNIYYVYLFVATYLSVYVLYIPLFASSRE